MIIRQITDDSIGLFQKMRIQESDKLPRLCQGITMPGIVDEEIKTLLRACRHIKFGHFFRQLACIVDPEDFIGLSRH